MVGWCRGSQPVEEPLAPDISTGLADHSYYRSPLLLQHRSVVEARTRSDVWTGGARSSRDPLLLSPHPPVHRADLTPTTRFSLFFFFSPGTYLGCFSPPPAVLCVCISVSTAGPLQFTGARKKKKKVGVCCSLVFRQQQQQRRRRRRAQLKCPRWQAGRTARCRRSIGWSWSEAAVSGNQP